MGQRATCRALHVKTKVRRLLRGNKFIPVALIFYLHTKPQPTPTGRGPQEPLVYPEVDRPSKLDKSIQRQLK